jgi:hypothetical protein
MKIKKAGEIILPLNNNFFRCQAINLLDNQPRRVSGLTQRVPLVKQYLFDNQHLFHINKIISYYLVKI